MWAETPHRVRAGQDLVRELERQLELKASGKFPYTCEDDGLTDGERLAILVEEVGEVARAMQDHNLDNFREEIIQVAAIAVSWLAGMYRRTDEPKNLPRIYVPEGYQR